MNTKLQVKNNSIAIVGWHEGIAGRVETWLEKTHDYHITCFINPLDTAISINPNQIKRSATNFSYPTKNEFKKRPLINKLKWAEYLIEIGISKVLITTEDLKERYKEICYAKKNNLKLINAIHPTAHVMADVIMMQNVILHEHSFIGYRAELYDGVFIDGARIGHHSVIKECSNIVTGALLGGNVTIGRFTKIYLGAIIKNKIQVGQNVVIGAGSVVLTNINDDALVIQKPGQVIIDNFNNDKKK